MSSQGMAWAWQETTSTSEAKFVLVVLAHEADGWGTATSFDEVVRRVTSLDDEQIATAIKELGARGLVELVEVEEERWAVLAPKAIDRERVFQNAPLDSYPPAVASLARNTVTSMVGALLGEGGQGG